MDGEYQWEYDEEDGEDYEWEYETEDEESEGGEEKDTDTKEDEALEDQDLPDPFSSAPPKVTVKSNTDAK